MENFTPLLVESTTIKIIALYYSGHESNSIRESTIQCNCVSETPPLSLGSISRKQIDRSGSKFGDFQSIVCIQYTPNLRQIGSPLKGGMVVKVVSCYPQLDTFSSLPPFSSDHY